MRFAGIVGLLSQLVAGALVIYAAAIFLTASKTPTIVVAVALILAFAVVLFTFGRQYSRK